MARNAIPVLICLLKRITLQNCNEVERLTRMLMG